MCRLLDCVAYQYVNAVLNLRGHDNCPLGKDAFSDIGKWGKPKKEQTIGIKINPFETPAIMRLSLLTFLIEGAPSLDWNPGEQVALHCERSADWVDAREEAEGVTGMKQVLWETWPQKQQRNLSITMVWYYNFHPYFIFQSKLQPLCDHTRITLILRSYNYTATDKLLHIVHGYPNLYPWLTQWQFETMSNRQPCCSTYVRSMMHW